MAPELKHPQLELFVLQLPHAPRCSPRPRAPRLPSKASPHLEEQNQPSCAQPSEQKEQLEQDVCTAPRVGSFGRWRQKAPSETFLPRAHLSITILLTAALCCQALLLLLVICRLLLGHTTKFSVFYLLFFLLPPQHGYKFYSLQLKQTLFVPTFGNQGSSLDRNCSCSR